MIIFFFFFRIGFLMFEISLFNSNDLSALFEEKDGKKNFVPKNVAISSVIIDNREVKKNSLFVAIRGENNDGHNYIKSAVENGAVFVVCEYLNKDIKEFLVKKSVGYVIVDNSIMALKEMAIFQRSRLKAKVIGITGSVGKTTTREMFACVFRKFYKTFTNAKNYNNHIGLPLTICNTPLDTEILILEMGMNNVGEIDYLSKIARPDIAVITNVKNTHLGNFKDIGEIVEAKTEIFNGLNNQGIIVLNDKDDNYNKILEIAKEKGVKNILKVGGKNSSVFLSNFKFCDDFTTEFEVNCNCKYVKCRMEGYKLVNIQNSLFVFAVAEKFRLNLDEVAKALQDFKIVAGRGNLEKIDTTSGKCLIVFNDCYNSSPEALKASIISLGIFKKKNQNKRVIAVIGDMLELGEKSKEYHNEIADALIENGIKNVILVGKESKVIFDSLPNDNGFNKLYFATTLDLEKEIEKHVQDGDVLMFKASHSLHFDILIKKLKSL